MKGWCPVEVDEDGVFRKEIHRYAHCSTQNCGVSEGAFVPSPKDGAWSQFEAVYSAYAELRRTFETVKDNAGELCATYINTTGSTM